MIPVFFNGHGEWFIKNKNGQIYPHSDLISYVEYDSYHRCWHRTNPYDKASGLFMLTEEDENKRNEKEQKHKSQGYKFDEFNLNFVNTLELLPDSFSQCYLDCAALPPGPEIEADSKYFFKIKKYKNADCNLEGKLNPILYPVNIDEPSKGGIVTKEESTSNNPNKSVSTLDPRAEISYLRIIAALLEYISGETPGCDKHPSFEGESKLIEKIDELYGEYRGISKRTLEDKFPKAKASLKDTLR